MPPENSIVTPPAPHSGADSGKEIAALRKSLREARIAAREALSAPEREQRSQRIEAHLDSLIARLEPQRLAFCWPWRGEVDLVDWISRWLAADPVRQAALPVVDAPGQAMRFLRWHPDAPMEQDHHGIPVPAAAAAVIPEVVLIPLNVFDRAGYRLGYGGGYFDRTLAALRPAPICVGVAFELARADSVHPQDHDQPMDWIVTEAGAVKAFSD